MPNNPGEGFNSMPLGSVVKGFVMPQRGPTGDLQSTLNGEEARVLSPDRIVITGLKVDLYEAGGTRVGTVITAPRCDFWTVERRLSGHEGVEIERPDARITADAVDWDLKTQVALLHQRVRVVLPKISLGTPTPAPSQP